MTTTDTDLKQLVINKLTSTQYSGATINNNELYFVTDGTISSDDVDDTNATNKFVTSSDITTWNAKQDVINSSNKLSADLVDDTSSTNKFVTASDITTWNGKSDVSGTNDGTNWSTITINGTTKNIPSGGSGSTEVFMAEYGVTTFQEIYDAYSAGKIVLCYLGPKTTGPISIDYVATLNSVTTENDNVKYFDFYAFDGSNYRHTSVEFSTGWGGQENISLALAYQLSGKQDKAPAITILSGTSITLTDNSINTLTPSGNTTFTLPTVSDTSVFHQILVQLNLSTVYTIDLGTTTYFDGTAPDLSSTGNYNIIYEYDNSMSVWVVGSVKKG